MSAIVVQPPHFGTTEVASQCRNPRVNAVLLLRNTGVSIALVPQVDIEKVVPPSPSFERIHIVLLYTPFARPSEDNTVGVYAEADIEEASVAY